MKLKPTRADRLSPDEREIVDRFERGEIDAAEAGRLLIASVHAVRDERDETAASVGESRGGAEETDVHPDETPEEQQARALVERLAREAYDDPA